MKRGLARVPFLEQISETFLKYFFWNILVEFFSARIPLRNKSVKLFYRVPFRNNLAKPFFSQSAIQEEIHGMLLAKVLFRNELVERFVQFHSGMNPQNAGFYSFRDNIFALFRTPVWCNRFENKVKYSCWI